MEKGKENLHENIKGLSKYLEKTPLTADQF